MSWDAVIMRLPDGATTIDDLTTTSVLLPLGSRADVLAILAAISGLQVPDPERGHLTGPGWAMEILVLAEEPVTAVSLYVRGAVTAATGSVLAIAEALQGSAFGCSDMALLTRATATAHAAGFAAYRDRTITGGAP